MGNNNIGSGTLTGPATVNVSGLTTWSGGTMSGPGVTNANGGMSINDGTASAAPTLIGRTINNAGTAIVTAANNNFGSGGVFNNQSPNGTFDIRANTTFGNLGGATSSFNNAGTLLRSAGTGTAIVNLTLNNTGSASVQTGTLQIIGTVTQLSGSTLTGGTWNVSANSTLDFSTGSNITTNQGNVSLTGANSLFAKIDSLATNSGSFAISSGRNFTTLGALSNAGTINVGSSSTLTLGGTNTYTQTAGATTVSGTLTANAENISGGTATLGTSTITNVVSLYKAEGNANDSADGNNGSFQNGATTTTAGKIGSAFSFDGVNDMVVVPSATNLNPSELTVSAWVKLNSQTGQLYGGASSLTGLQYILFKRNSRSSGFEDYVLIKYRLPGGQDVFSFEVTSASGTATVLNSTTTVAVGQWYHLAATYDGATAKLYVNGVLESTVVHGFALDHTTNPLVIGRTGQDGDPGEVNFDAAFNGLIDEPTIFNRALSASEVGQLAAASYDTASSSTLTIPTGKFIGPVSVSGSGVLNGSGIVAGNLSNAATVGPGNSPGIVTVNGNYSQTSAGTLNIEVGGTNPGAPDFDQLLVNGTVTLAGTLNVTALPAYVPAPVGTAFKIIDNDGTDAVSGTFTGRAEGSTFTLGVNTFQISYVGGTGNDVVLTVTARTVSWDGGAGTFNWSDANNWNIDSLPTTGDDVTIPDLSGTPTISSSGTVAIKSLTSAENLAITGGTFSVVQPPVLSLGLTESGGVFFAGTSLSNASTVSVGNGSTLAVTGVPSSGLVSLWHGEGNSLDSAGGNNGSLVGDAGFATGRVGQTFTFDGAGDSVRMPAAASLNVGTGNWVDP